MMIEVYPSFPLHLQVNAGMLQIIGWFVWFSSACYFPPWFSFVGLRLISFSFVGKLVLKSTQLKVLYVTEHSNKSNLELQQERKGVGLSQITVRVLPLRLCVHTLLIVMTIHV
jgi:hypothetical protein